MPANTGLVLTIQTPANNSTVKLNLAFTVTGTVTGPVTPEPIGLVSLTLQIDNGPLTHASFSRSKTNKNKSLIVFNYTGSVTVTRGADPHTLTVSATSDRNVTVRQTRQVFTDVPFAVDAPAILVELLGFLLPDGTNPLDPKLPGTIALAQSMQVQLQPLADQLAVYNKILAGPNMYEAPAAPGFFALRIGFWIEDLDFPVVAADPKNGFPLPRLPDKGAVAGLNRLGRLSPPVPNQVVPTFAVLVPLPAMQKLAFAVLPTIRDQVAGDDVEIDSITLRTDNNEFVAEIKGSYRLQDFTLAIHESFGIVHVGSGSSDADPGRPAPTVTKSSIDVDFGLLTLLLSVLFPPLGVFLQLVRLIKIDPALSDANQSTSGSLKDALNALAARIPFSDTALPLAGIDPFPRIILNWDTFTSTPNGITGTGFTTLDGRFDSMTSIPLSGPGEITGAAGEVAGNVFPGNYTYGFVNIGPDPDSVRWQVSGTGSASGSIDLKKPSFKIRLPMPKKPQPGKTYPFTLTVTAVETCGSDHSRHLNATGAFPIEVVVKKGGPNPTSPRRVAKKKSR